MRKQRILAVFDRSSDEELHVVSGDEADRPQLPQSDRRQGPGILRALSRAPSRRPRQNRDTMRSTLTSTNATPSGCCRSMVVERAVLGDFQRPVRWDTRSERRGRRKSSFHRWYGCSQSESSVPGHGSIGRFACQFPFRIGAWVDRPLRLGRARRDSSIALATTRASVTCVN